VEVRVVSPAPMKKVLVIVGPTASGKSDLAVRLAKKFKGEVISADSRQIYKGLDKGSGKITKAEMLGIPHHMLDVADPKKYFSVSEYKTLAQEKLVSILEKKKLPIIVGGTGFYIDTLTGSVYLPEVPPNQKLRAKLEKYSAETLYKILKKKDPRRARKIDQHNKVRIIRALEIVETLGKVPKVIKSKVEYKFIFVGLKPDQKVLEKNIYKRIWKRLYGMLHEARKLHLNGLSYVRMEALGLEYRYLARLMQKKITKAEFIEQLYKEIRAYSKRQYAWFKRNKKIKWFGPQEYKKIETYTKKQLGGR
jgi:tRNA dimethylallyltransferase